MTRLTRPNLVKAFATNATHGNYLPIEFGTNKAIPKGDYAKVANDNFEFGLESLEGDLQLKDLNSVFFYQSSLLKYLFERGIPEFSAYQDYYAGSVVSYNNELWIAIKEQPASLKEFEKDPCNPCKVAQCEVPVVPSKENGWCKLVTHCTFDSVIETLHQKDDALETAINSIKGVVTFSVKDIDIAGKQTPVVELLLSDGSTQVIPMSNFGSIKQLDNGDIKVVNPDKTEFTITAHKATTKVTNTKGDTLGFVHKDVYPNDVKTFDKVFSIVDSESLDQEKGFYWDKGTQKWKVDLNDLVKSDSGLKVDTNGNIFIDPAYTKAEADKAKKAANDYTDGKLNDLKEAGAKVYTHSPISGDGTKANPLNLKFGKDFTTDANGNLVLQSNAPDKLTTFQSGYKLGFHTFNGGSNPFVVGLPINIASEDKEQDRAMSHDQIQGDDYDFNGYYIASENQLDIWLQGVNNTAWFIMNDGGINPDGTLKEPNNWGKWQKLDNSNSITDNMVKTMQDQINSLTGQMNTANGNIIDLQNRVQTIEHKNNETCKIPVQTQGNYTLADADNTIICTGGTITVPANLPVGRLFTVIQSTGNAVTIQGDGNTQVIAPMDGSLKLAGANAVVTILISGFNEARVFGQTE